MNCGCPQAASLASLPSVNCKTTLGQIQKIVVQRLKTSAGAKNGFNVSTKDPALKASWTPLLAATDGTKVVASPYIHGPTSEPGAARTFGGGNATAGGITIVLGRETTKTNGMFYNEDQAVISVLKSFACENVGIYYIDEYGNIGMTADDPLDPENYFPIPLKSWFVGDMKLGGLEEPNSNMISWEHMPNWSDKLVVIKPTDFDALSELGSL